MPTSRSSLLQQAAIGAKIELDKRQKARSNLIDFAQYTKADYAPVEHHRQIAAALEAVERGEIRRLLIAAPPRHGKSQLASRSFPAWYLGKHPERTVISTSYAASLADEFGREVRNLVGSPGYRALFPGVTLAEDSQAVQRWNTNRNGGYIAAGVGGGVTGKGAWVIIVDDPHKGRAEAESIIERDNVWAWYRGDLVKRLDTHLGAIIIIMTRWHEDDLVGRLEAIEQETGEQWKKLIFPAIDPQGRALWPERFPLDYLKQVRALSEYDWASEYEQRPRPEGGSFFTLESMLHEGKPWEPTIPVDTVFAVIDSAMKTGKQHDGLAVTYFGYSAHGQNDYPLAILDWDYKQVEGAMLEDWLPTVFEYLEDLALKYRALRGSSGAMIEDKVSGTVLLQQGQNYGWPVHAIDNKLTAMGKSERAINVSGYVHRGDVKFTVAAYNRVVTFKSATKNHLLSQLLGFRAGTKETGPDDLLDTFTYGVALSVGNQEGF